MFIPGDQFLAAALSAQPGLIEYAMGRRIAVATPSSLISLLWAVANGWQQQRMSENAQAVRDEAEEFYKRMLTFINHYQKVGDRLDRVVKVFNESVRSFDSRIVPQGRRIADLTTGREDDFPQPSSIENVVRESSYAEETQPRLPENSSGA